MVILRFRCFPLAIGSKPLYQAGTLLYYGPCFPLGFHIQPGLLARLENNWMEYLGNKPNFVTCRFLFLTITGAKQAAKVPKQRPSQQENKEISEENSVTSLFYYMRTIRIVEIICDLLPCFLFQSQFCPISAWLYSMLSPYSVPGADPDFPNSLLTCLSMMKCIVMMCQNGHYVHSCSTFTESSMMINYQWLVVSF